MLIKKEIFVKESLQRKKKSNFIKWHCVKIYFKEMANFCLQAEVDLKAGCIQSDDSFSKRGLAFALRKKFQI